MRTNIKTFALLLASVSAPLFGLPATAQAGNTPFDFSYRVAGAGSLRPTLVFNDGKDTYIELDQEVTVSVEGGAHSFRQGPYYVIRGIQPEIILRNKRERIAILYEANLPIYKYEPPTAEPALAPTVATSAASPSIAAAPVAITPASPAPTAESVAAATPATQTNVQPDAVVVAEAVKPAECRPSVIKSESSVLVAFGTDKKQLSAEARTRLESESAKRDGQLESVRLRMPSNAASGLQKLRQQHLADVLVGAGIPRSFIQPESGDTYAGMTEVTFVHGTEKPCAKDAPVISINGNLLTVISNGADAKEILSRVAGAAQKDFRIEGVERELPVTVSVAAEPLPNVLARVGAKMDSSADIVLRDNELVLRFN